ncbi:MAG: glycosyl hydrolase family protein [Ruminococcaceae bacterium]|nr:glycosyl hydrolase family protein [Oscillospiraceae bacterium]
MNKKRLISLVLAVCVVCSVFVAGSVILNKDDKVYIEFSKNAYTVVAPSGVAGDAGLADSVYNVMLGMGLVASRSDDAAEGSEIIIGKCDRAETAEALSILNSKGKGYDSDYIIYEKDGKIVIVGNSDSATEQAVDRFVNLCLASGQIESGLVYTSLASSEAFTTISINGTKLDSSYVIVTPQYNMSYLVRIQLDKLTAAISEKAGYTLTEKTDTKSTTFTQADINVFEAQGWKNCDTAAEYQAYVAKLASYNTAKSSTETVYEIVIGDCARYQCPVITDTDEYTIKVAGNKIFLNGGSPAATAMAVSEFTKMVNTGDLTLTDASTASYDYYDAIGAYDRNNYYTLKWADDFDGSSIDTGKWAVSYGRDSTIYSDGLNERLPARASKELNNNYIQDGKLYIAATYDDEYYYGGHLSTRNTMRIQYGYVETSCLKPLGQGLWTSMWVDNEGLANDAYARMEIDVNESYGSGSVTLQNSITWLNTTGRTFVGKTYKKFLKQNVGFYGTNYTYNKDTRGFHLDFHTFGYAWDADKLLFTVDGKVTHSYNYATEPVATKDLTGTTTEYSTAALDAALLQEIEPQLSASGFAVPAYIRLSMAVGFATRNYVIEDDAAEWQESNKFVVDYVHVYQYDNQTIYYLGTSNQRGDVNGDGNVDALDATYVARYLAGWTKYDFKNMDLGAAEVTGDGLITEEDLATLNGYLVGKNKLVG